MSSFILRYYGAILEPNTAAFMLNMPPLFAFGEGFAIYLSVLIIISTVAFVTSSVNVLLWAALSRFLAKNRIGKAAAFFALAAGVGGGVLYMFLYDERRGIWLLPAVAGACVMTNATLTVISLIRMGGDWPRMKLRTLLALVAVAAVVLATIAPAFRES